tara:strand:+ start:552 stop:1154 length:603 start_codon:yes stop_codon:yes gene_type:complete
MRNKVITLDGKLFKDKCINLHELILENNFIPDVLIGIASGGVKVLDEIPEISINEYRFNLELRRNSTKHKNKLSFIRYLNINILNFLRIMESIYVDYKLYISKKKDIKQSEKYLKKKRFIKTQLLQQEIKISNKKVLIVDDAIDSGETVLVIKSALEEQFENIEVKVGVITKTLKYSYIDPDFCLFKNVLIRFPWSNDFK